MAMGPIFDSDFCQGISLEEMINNDHSKATHTLYYVFLGLYQRCEQITCPLHDRPKYGMARHAKIWHGTWNHDMTWHGGTLF